MEKQQFKTISMTGRLAYAILCLETYLTRKHPEKDFTCLSNLLWLGTSSMGWDDYYELMDDLMSEFLFASETYDPENFSQLKEEDFKKIHALLRGIEKESDSFFSILHDITSVYAYSEIPGCGAESIEILFKGISILEALGIPLPNIESISFASFSERNGWGKRFDGTKLSLILNK